MNRRKRINDILEKLGLILIGGGFFLPLADGALSLTGALLLPLGVVMLVLSVVREHDEPDGNRP